MILKSKLKYIRLSKLLTRQLLAIQTSLDLGWLGDDTRIPLTKFVRLVG